MTVAFLGGVGEQAAERAWAVTEGFDHAPITVRLSGLAPMGNPRRPTALSVLLGEGRDETIRLIAALQDPMLEAAGAPPARRSIKPHITVARPPRKANAAMRKRAVAWAESVPPIDTEVTIDRVALYTWSTDRRERKFRVVHERALSGG
jgi:2'-5' RNA ligase